MNLKKFIPKNYFNADNILTAFFRNIKKLYKTKKEKAASYFQKFAPHEKYFIVLFSLIIAGSILALGVQLYISKTEQVPTSGGEYREAVIGTPRFINPVLASINDVDRDLVRLVYSSLMRYNGEGDVIPDLAEKYEILDNGKTYKFTLKENLIWQDGHPLTVDDIVFTIKLIQDSQYASPLQQAWRGVKIRSEDRDIIFTIITPYPPFIENTTLGILPKHIWEKIQPNKFALTELNLEPIGSGPYKVEKFTKDGSGIVSSYSLKKNDLYHDTKPYINRIIFKFYQNEEAALKAYNSKAIDGMAYLSPSNIENIKDVQTVNLHEMTMPRYFAIFINQHKNELLKDIEIRQALAYATDRNKIINNILKNFAQKADSPIPPTSTKYYNKNIAGFSYDLERAKSIFEAKGWIDLSGDGIRENSKSKEENTEHLTLTLTTANTPELIKVANEISSQWRDVGVLLNVKTEELSQLQQNTIKTRSYELLMFGVILGAIPDPFSFWHSSQANDPGLNLVYYDDKTVDKLLENARQELNEEERIKKYNQFQEEVIKASPVIFLYNPSYIYPIQKHIRGVNPAYLVDTSNRFLNIQDWYIETKRVFK